MESSEVYITGVSYNNISWTDNPDGFLDEIYNNLYEINDFSFSGISVNMSEVYNVNLKSSYYEAMMVYLKGVKYKHSGFINLNDIKQLESEIKRVLNYISGMAIGQIEFRTNKIYTDLDLGMIEIIPFRAN